MCDFRLKPVLITMFCCLMMALLINSEPAIAAKKSTKAAITPSELQSQVMSFADRFIARVNGATIDYVYIKGYARKSKDRFAVNSRRLYACTAAVSIASGANPEVALLDMVSMVTLLRLTTQDLWVKKNLVPRSQIFLKAYIELEKDLWTIANSVLSKEQSRELRTMINEWHIKNIDTTIAVTSIRFGDFAKNRRQSTLIKDGKASGFLKTVKETNIEIEQARVLAERTVFMAERQPTLIRWQIEQIFFDLAMEPEFREMLNSSSDIGQAAQRLSMIAEKMPKLIMKERKEAIVQAMSEISREREAFLNQLSGIITKERKEAIIQAMSEVSKERQAFIGQAISEVSKERETLIKQLGEMITKERKETIVQAMSGVSKERNALINQTSENIIGKGFYLGAALILMLLLGAILARLIYRYLEMKIFEKQRTPRVQKAKKLIE